jgi:phosphoglycolate phosphatase
VTKPNLARMLGVLDLPARYDPDPAPHDGLLVTVDCQYGAGNVRKVAAAQVAVIDHHIQEGELPALAELRPYLGSCATLVWKMLEDAGFTPDAALSTALAYGLFTDTNGFAEVRHPLDRDLRDAPGGDGRILRDLKRCNLSLEDMATASRALAGLAYHPEGRFVLAATAPCDPNILGFVSDMAMQVDGVDMAVVFSEGPEGFKYSVRTATREVKASDLARALSAGGLGSGGGHADKAGGFISAANFERLHAGARAAAILEQRIREHLAAYELVDCAQGPLADARGFAEYEKLPVPVGFVPCERLFPGKAGLSVRMLEGDISITAGPDTCLMIGSSGEVYPIEKAKFAASYTPLGRPLEEEFAYPPCVLDTDRGDRVPLLPHAEACVGKKVRVRARELDRGMKVFTRWDADNYLRGDAGDWLVMRGDDPADLYIVTRDLFPRLYARV